MTQRGKIAGFVESLRSRLRQALRTGADLQDVPPESVLLKPEGYKPVRITLAGVMHEDNDRYVKRLTLGEIVLLHREPENPHDTNAIVVKNQKEQRLGYVGKHIATNLALYMDSGKNPLKAVVTELTSVIAGIGAVVNLYLPESLLPDKEQKFEYYCDTNADITYLYIDCDGTILNQILGSLQEKGFQWIRSGLSYRPASNGRQYRWYVRLDEGASQERIEEFFKESFGISPDHKDANQEKTTEIEEWINIFDTENNRLKAELQKAKEEKARIATMLRNELDHIIETLLPNLKFLRSSLDVLTYELYSFQPILRTLHRISTNPGKVTADKVYGVDGWWELHFNTGKDDHGRLYYKHLDGKWMVLVSLKDSQSHDIRYLRRIG